ncbi:uncharacterized protein M437DRAFT_65816 [Aureobasidium melanogenum CBS 110374]|uniref:Uncharacterized protein n=1 Tax=Aureobasidium melanogenum (strain CBS 110374) TaxID=1043003 RepID=A0A074VR40_AURM1|nr:uncharacterized protein M437DRAFT_65816 [Aureobasidium melanogenum CBS 110374]KEQ63225.1 hypothetical protein M437DRAFT_65816 [Aureobasidium melanogenum CBS 110374]
MHERLSMDTKHWRCRTHQLQDDLSRQPTPHLFTSRPFTIGKSDSPRTPHELACVTSQSAIAIALHRAHDHAVSDPSPRILLASVDHVGDKVTPVRPAIPRTA